jgi:hypothetical protein
LIPGFPFALEAEAGTAATARQREKLEKVLGYERKSR